MSFSLSEPLCDVVMMAESEGEMRSMLKKLEGDLERKGLELNVQKTKLIRFKREGGR